MSSKNNSRFIPLAGAIASALLNWMLVQYWLADFFAKQMEVSRSSSYRALSILILLMAMVRIVNIQRGRDLITNQIDQYFDHQKKE